MTQLQQFLFELSFGQTRKIREYTASVAQLHWQEQ